MSPRASAILMGVALAMAQIACGQTAPPVILLQTNVEDKQVMILATVTAGGNPVEGATVAFFAQRTFGDLPLGQDQTLDDGTAAIPFPSELPGGPDGILIVKARIMAPQHYTSTVARAVFSGGAKKVPSAEEYPRALWAPRAPLPLILAIFTLLSAAWFTYIYVIAQLFGMRKGRNGA